MKKTKQTKHKPSARLLTLLLAFTMVFTMMPGMVWADEGSAVSEAENVTGISSQGELAQIGGVQNGKYKLTKDITLDDSWKEIDPKAAFTLDGNGHSITLNGKSVFYNVIDADTTISNLIIKGEVSGTGTLGTLASSYNGTVRNCSFNADVKFNGNNEDTEVGGIIATLKGTVSNCVVTGTITNGKSKAYGSVGNGKNGTIKNTVSVGCAQLGMTSSLSMETWVHSNPWN